MTSSSDSQKVRSNERSNFAQIDSESPEFAWPTVVAVVITHNPGEWLEECLESLSKQEYPDLTTLVVDVASDTDLTQRVASSMSNAYVRRLEEDVNFAQAVNLSVNSVEGATYVLICHDDVVIEDGAITEMVEEAFRSNASIIGPKIIDAANRDQLLSVGGMIDHFGVPFSGIEPDEVDQGQHDGVRDVFFVSSAAMLVRADLFRALGGFDVQCFPGAEDIDLAWRAHLVGARVLVQPDAVVRHHETSDRQKKSRISATAIVARHRMRAVLKNASGVSLAWIVPIALALHTIEGITWLFRLNPRRSWLLFSGWIWNIRHFGDTRRERSKIQKTREVSDRIISTHQIGGSARIRRFFTSIIHLRQLSSIASASKTFASSQYSKRTRETPIYLVAMVVYLLAIRSIFLNGVQSVGEFVQWPSFTNQVNALIHGGLPAYHEPMLSSTFGRLVALAMTAIFGGHAQLAQAIFVVSLIPIGGFGVRLLLKERAMGPRSIAIAAITYGTFALGMHSFSFGDLGSIILLAGLPYLLRGLSNRKPRQSGLAGALMVAFYPAAVIVFAVIAFVFIFAGERFSNDLKVHTGFGDLTKRVRTVLMSALVIFSINFGLIIDSIRGIDRNAIGLSDTSSYLAQYLFPNLSVTIAIYVSIAMSFCALVVGRNERTSEIRILAISVSLLATSSMVLIHFAQPVIEVSALYVMMQLAASISVGVGIHAFADEMKLRSFGIFHFATTMAIGAIFASVLMSIPVLRDGTFGLPSRSWSNQIEVERNERVLFIGESRSLPGRSILAPLNRSFSIAQTSHATLSSSFSGPASSLDKDVREIYSSIMSTETTHAGFLLARLSIGSVVVPTSRAPETSVQKTDRALLNALDRQSDLVRLRDRNGLIVYQNSEFNKGYSLTSTVARLTPSEVFEMRNRNDNEIAKVQNAPASPSTSLISFLSIAALVLVLLWPRRHQLISARSLKISKIVSESQDKKSADSSKIIDLEDEHKLDQTIDGDHGDTSSDQENIHLDVKQ